MDEISCSVSVISSQYIVDEYAVGLRDLCCCCIITHEEGGHVILGKPFDLQATKLGAWYGKGIFMLMGRESSC